MTDGFVQMIDGHSVRAGLRLAVPILALCGLSACVGDEPVEEGTEATDAADPVTEKARKITGSDVAYDTIKPGVYHVFKREVDSEDPRKITLRLLVLESTLAPQLGRTAQVALDSLTAADTSLAAARAIVYVPGRVTGPGEMSLAPRVWGAWVPPEGWDSVTTASRDRIHRTYIYHGAPGAMVGESVAPSGSGGS